MGSWDNKFISRNIMLHKIASILRKKKLATLITVCLFVSLYFTLKLIFSFIEFDYISTDKLSLCVDDRLKSFKDKINGFDAVILEDKDYSLGFPFVGNGFIGTSLLNPSGLFLRGREFLSIAIGINLITSLNLAEYVSQETNMIDILEGAAYKFRCFKHEDEMCVSSTSKVYAHRLIPELLVQSLELHNPKGQAIEFVLDGAPSFPGISVHRETVNIKSLSMHMEIFMVDPIIVSAHSINLHDHENSGLDPGKNNSYRKPGSGESVYLLVAIMRPNIPDRISLSSGETKTFAFYSGVRTSTDWFILDKVNSFADLKAPSTRYISQLVMEMKTSLKNLFTEINDMQEATLFASHSQAWVRTWQSGMSISSSKAEGALNGNRYNVTMYYLLSNVPDHLSMASMASEQALALFKTMSTNNLCFDGPSTFYSMQLWAQTTDYASFLSLIDLWLVTLKRRGCYSFWQLGSHGLLQAVLYSLASLRTSTGHIAMWFRPEELHRDVHFRAVNVVPEHTFVNFGLSYQQDDPSSDVVQDLYLYRYMANPRAPLIALPSQRVAGSVDFIVGHMRNKANWIIYACSANCDPILPVTEDRLSVPVYVTNPVSALLHLSSEAEYNLREFARAQHLNDVQIAQGPRRDILTMHRHGHVLRGLPIFFWVTLGFLVLLFHVFICKIVYSELWKDKDGSYDATDNMERSPRSSDDYETRFEFRNGTVWNNSVPRKRVNSGAAWNSHSATMAGIYVNSHLASRRKQAQQGYHNYQEPVP